MLIHWAAFDVILLRDHICHIQVCPYDLLQPSLPYTKQTQCFLCLLVYLNLYVLP
ncbi:hypothetical protein T03_9785 [Trichinella britovi]|uniref:Uncharacterized protein n=1 Tax=Trichinella britovi TaxID=45882 RepID=A0A0V0Z3H7_TRIBR|nr:hypothetical protein T03_9785 [Trichinella britovi]